MNHSPQPRSAAEISGLHTPVMLERTLELFEPVATQPDATVIDATLGLGGHTHALLHAYPQLRVIGIDRDSHAQQLAAARLADYAERLTLVHSVYDAIDLAARTAGVEKVDGVLFDLGVSSMQLDEAERGFAYAQDAPLDMRMDQTSGRTAADIVAAEPEGSLRAIFERYGEEPLAARYARAIVEARETTPITRSSELVDILQRATPAAVSSKRHPAKRVFQALRVAVNEELQVLERAIPAAISQLRIGGRIIVMSYQSLEDRMVKREFARRSQSTAPRGLPVELPEHKPELRLLTRGAELASEHERATNPRAIPVRLRAAEKVREVA